jgi:hypothetical protein
MPDPIRSLQCERCGGAFEARLAPSLTCPFCRHRQSAQALQAELQGYQQAVDARVAAATVEVQHIAGWNRWHRRSVQKSTWVALLLVAGVPIVLAIVAIVLHQAGVLHPDAHPQVSFGIMGASYVGLIGYLIWWAAGRKKGAQVEMSDTQVACPSCGAPGTLTPGQVVAACAYCKAALVPSQTVMQRGLDAARQAHRAARIERFRTERRGMADMMKMSAHGLGYTLVVFGPMALMLLLAAIAFSVEMLSGEEPFDPAIFGLWGMAAALVGGLAVYVIHHRSKKRAWHQAMGDLALQFRGTLITEIIGWVEWLNRYWPSEVPVSEIYKSSYGCAAALDAYGHPTLVLVDPTSMQNRVRRLELFVAAWIPGLSDGSGTAPEPTAHGGAARQWLREQGFAVSLCEAGLRLRADDATIQTLHRNPAAAHELAPVITAATTFAHAIGAEPATAIP